MSKKQSKIHTKSYMLLTPDGNTKICVRDLSEQQKNYLGALLQTKLLNTFYAGKAQFWTEDTSRLNRTHDDIHLQ